MNDSEPMSLERLSQICRDRLANAPATGRPGAILLVINGPSTRQSRLRRRLAPGGPLGTIACSHRNCDVCWFDVVEVLAFCERKLASRQGVGDA